MEQLIRPLVFICHNREDKPVAERICEELVKAGHETFYDKWDIRPGDSFIEKISEGIAGSSYLLILLSKHSVNSSWVKKELEIALAKQIKTNHLMVIPCLLEDCDIPVFLESISYADFRNSFEDGINELLPAIAKVDALKSGRLKEGDEAWIHDWAIDNALPDPATGKFTITFIILSWYGTETYSCYYFINCTAGSKLSDRLREYPEHLGFGRYMMFLSTIKINIDNYIRITKKDFGVWLPDAQEHRTILKTIDEATKNPVLVMDFRARRLGTLSDKATMLWIGKMLNEFLEQYIKQITDEVPRSSFQQFEEWLKQNPFNGEGLFRYDLDEIY